MKRLVVVGGGVSGLAAAAAAARGARAAGLELQVLVLEREGAVGGKARSERQGGWLVETGPTGYLDAGELDPLVAAAGTAKLPASAAAARRFVLRAGRLRELRPHPLALLGVLGPLGLLRAAREPWIAPGEPGVDESVFDFARRRLGRQAAERLVAPMVLGVFAGDARGLSVGAAFPKLRALEQQHGSLIRGMRALRKARKIPGAALGPAGVLTSFEGGLQSLLRALAGRALFDVRCNAVVETIEVGGAARYRVQVAGDPEPVPAHAVILACEPFAAARVLPAAAEDAARELAAIPCPAVAVVALGYPRAAASGVPRGFGVLVPRGEGLRMLGCLWDTHLFAGRSPDGQLLLRAMFGGTVDPGIAELSADQLLALARLEVETLFHIPGPPSFELVKQWPRAIPQYELGHARRVARIEESLARLPGLFVAGNGLHGVAFPRAAHAGETAAERAVELLRGKQG